jgi:hypothetical protein
MPTRSSDLLATSLALALARYLKDHPEAAPRAGAWRDADVESWITAPEEAIRAEATKGLEALDEWRDETREAAPDEWEAGRVEFLQAQLNFQSARSGSFATASGSLADFLGEMGEEVDVLDEH